VKYCEILFVQREIIPDGGETGGDKAVTDCVMLSFFFFSEVQATYGPTNRLRRPHATERAEYK